MSGVKAIFKKQIKDILKNMGVLIQFVLFPAVAFAMTHFVAGSEMFADVDAMTEMPGMNFVLMFSAIFVGMALIPTVATIIAEDRERKSLRFLVMAGVRPAAYLLGIGGVIFFTSLLPSLAFALIGGFSGQQFLIFMAAMMSGVVASTFLGATIGIFAKNTQSAAAMAMPFAMILGFGPMIGMFNEQIGRNFRFFYTQQLDAILNSFGPAPQANLWHSFGIIWANVAILLIIFSLTFAKKGLKA